MQFLIIFLPFLWLLGQLLAKRLNLSWHHHLLLGFIAYFAVFNIMSIPFTLLGLSWKAYYYSQLLFHGVSLGAVVYLYFYYYQYHREWSIVAFKNKVYKYWPVYIVFLIYVGFSWFNTSTIFWTNHTGAVWDDYFYSAKALKSIDVNHLFQQHFVYLNQVVPLQEKLVVWELFWSFMSKVFHIHTMTLAHKYIPVLVHMIFIMSFDEVLRLIKHDKQNKYYIFGLLIFVIFGYIQSELVKTLYMTWYGNVVVATSFLPLLLVILVNSLNDKRYLVMMMLLPITFIGFSNGIIVFLGITYILSGLIWLNYKQYKIKYAIASYSLLLSIIVVVLFVFSYMITRQFTMFSSIAEMPAIETEKDIFTNFFNVRLPILFISVSYFIIQISKNKLSRNEMIIIGLPLFIMFLGLIPVVNNIMYNTLNFSFRRLLESVSLFVMIYAWIALLNQTYKQIKWQYFAILVVIIVYFYAKTTRIYILEEQRIFSPSAILQPYKVHPLTEQLAIKFQKISKDKPITVAFRSEFSDKGQHFNRIFATKGADEERFLHYNFGDALVGINKNIYLYKFNEKELSLEQLRKDKVNYFVTNNHFLKTIICKYYNGQVVDTLEDATLNHPIYIIQLND